MAQAIQTSKFGTLDTSGRVPVYLAGAAQDNTTPALNLGLGFTVNGQKYTFIPEDRITTGSATSNQGRIYPGFLNPQLLSNLKNTAEYVDISGTQFGNFDIGNFIAQQMGGSTKGYLAKEENVQPIIDAGVTFYDPSITGRVTGLGSANGQPAYIMPSGNSYLTPDGRIATTTRQLVGWRESGGLGGLGSFLASIDPSSALSQAATQLFQPVEKAVTAGVADVSKALSTDDAKKALGIAAAYFLPGVGAALGQTLVTQGLITGAAIPYASAIGTALVQAGAGVAQGQSFDTALTNATVNAVTQTGSQNVAGYISKLGASPEVANAVTSVGASGLATAAKGGSAADIERNMTGALAGSTVTGLTGDKLSGAVVGGAVTGGAMGAATGAAGVLGAPKTNTDKTTTSVSGVDPGVQVAGGDDASAINLARISATPEMLGKEGEKSSPITTTTEDGITLYKRSVTGTTSDGKPYGYVVTYDPGAPQGKQFQYETGYVAGPDGNLVDPSGGAGVSVSFKRPDFTATDTSKTGGTVAGEGLVVLGDKSTGGGTSVSPADQKVLDLIKPTPTTGGESSAAIATPKTPPGRGVETDEERIARLNAQAGRVIAGEADYTARSRPGAGTGNATGNVVITDTGGGGGGGGNAAGNVVVGPGAGGGGGPGGNVTIDAGGGGGGGNVSGNVAVTEDKPVVDDKVVVGEETPADKEPPPDEVVDPEYKPEVFIYGGTTPKPKTRTTINLGTTLQAPFYPSSTLGQALTGYRGAGEIEGKKTGKPRRDVWNEESLRLKDALGL